MWESSWATIEAIFCLRASLYSKLCSKYVTRPQFSIAPQRNAGIAIWSVHAYNAEVQLAEV